MSGGRRRDHYNVSATNPSHPCHGRMSKGESHPPGISHLNKGPISGIKGQKKVERQSLQRDTDTPMPAPGAELTLAGLQYNFMMGDGAMVRFVRDTRH